MHCRFIICLHFAVGCNNRRRVFWRLLRFPIRQNSGLSCSTCTCTRGNLQQIFFAGGAGKSGKKVDLSVSLSFKMFLANLHACPRAHRSCLSNLFLTFILKFHSVGTVLMKNFDLHFSERWSFVFSDVCVTLRNFCESYSSNWSQDFCALP